MKAKIKTFKKNEKSSYILVIIENMAFLRILDGNKNHVFRETEREGELIGNDLHFITKSGHKVIHHDLKKMNLKQIEYDKFIELHPEYRIKIENYINWHERQKKLNKENYFKCQNQI